MINFVKIHCVRADKDYCDQQTMEEFDDLDTYNGDTEHDMWVDFTYHENTGDLAGDFDDEHNDGYSGSHYKWD